MKALNFEEVKEHISKSTPPSLTISIILCQPQSEMNIGHIFRLSDAAAVKHVYLINPSEHIKWHKIEKLSRKNTRHVSYSIHSSKDEIEKSSNWIALEYTTESQDLFRAKKSSKEIVLVVGNEQRGVPEEILALCDSSIHIPMYGQHSSMNMAMATGIAVYTLLH